MKAFRMILIIALLLTVIIPESAEQVRYFFDGNKYLELPKGAKLAYVGGLSDMANILIETYDLEKSLKIWKVIKNMQLGQMTKILDRYLAEHLEELHFSVALSFLNAIDEIVFKE